jgi:hypothetical protein
MNVNSKVSGSFGSIGPVSLSGIPDTFHIDVDALPKINIGLDEIRMHSTIDPVEVKAAVAIERIPDIRAHLPADFSVGMSFFGVDLFRIRLCGEAQVITEPYHPNPCERCGTVPRDKTNVRDVVVQPG